MSRLPFGVPDRGRGRYSDPGHGLNSGEFSYPKMKP
jgi:hypothetical protein